MTSIGNIASKVGDAFNRIKDEGGQETTDTESNNQAVEAEGATANVDGGQNNTAAASGENTAAAVENSEGSSAGAEGEGTNAEITDSFDSHANAEANYARAAIERGRNSGADATGEGSTALVQGTEEDEAEGNRVTSSGDQSFAAVHESDNNVVTTSGEGAHAVVGNGSDANIINAAAMGEETPAGEYDPDVEVLDDSDGNIVNVSEGADNSDVTLNNSDNNQVTVNAADSDVNLTDTNNVAAEVNGNGVELNLTGVSENSINVNGENITVNVNGSAVEVLDADGNALESGEIGEEGYSGQYINVAPGGVPTEREAQAIAIASDDHNGQGWGDARSTRQQENRDAGGPGTIDADIAADIEAGTADAAQGDTVTYTVQSGDTLDDISEATLIQNGGEYTPQDVVDRRNEIAAANGITDVNNIPVGHQLDLTPVVTLPEAEAPAEAEIPEMPEGGAPEGTDTVPQNADGVAARLEETAPDLDGITNPSSLDLGEGVEFTGETVAGGGQSGSGYSNQDTYHEVQVGDETYYAKYTTSTVNAPGHPQTTTFSGEVLTAEELEAATAEDSGDTTAEGAELPEQVYTYANSDGSAEASLQNQLQDDFGDSVEVARNDSGQLEVTIDGEAAGTYINDGHVSGMPAGSSQWHLATEEELAEMAEDSEGTDVEDTEATDETAADSSEFNPETAAVDYLLSEVGNIPSDGSYNDDDFETAADRVFRNENLEDLDQVRDTASVIDQINANRDALSALDGHGGDLNERELENIQVLLEEGYTLDQLIAEGELADATHGDDSALIQGEGVSPDEVTVSGEDQEQQLSQIDDVLTNAEITEDGVITESEILEVAENDPENSGFYFAVLGYLNSQANYSNAITVEELSDIRGYVDRGLSVNHVLNQYERQ